MNNVGRRILVAVLAAIIGPLVLVLLLAFMWWARLFVAPVLVGLAIAYLLDPVMRWFQSRGCSRRLALVLLALIFVVSLVGLLLVVVPATQTELQQLVLNLADYYQRAEDWFANLYANYFVGKQLPPILDNARQQLADNLNVWLPQLVSNLTTHLVQSVGATLLWLVLTTLSTFYFLRDYEVFKAKLRKLIPERARPQVLALAGEVDAVIGRYLRGQATILLLVATTATCALLVVGAVYGTKYALVVGLLMGVGQLVPAVGITVTLLVACTVAYFTATHSAVTAMLVTAGVLLVINVVFDNVISPRIIGRIVGLHPLVALLAVLIGGWAFNFLGVLLAVPVVASIRVAIEHFMKAENRIFGPAPEAPPEAPPKAAEEGSKTQ